MTEAYPLQWPFGRPRSKRPERSRFAVSLARARYQLMHELHLLGARNIVISSNVSLRRDGLPYANQPEPDDAGVAVYFTYKKEQMSFACDRWDRVRDNVQAIRHTIAALRGIERWGTGEMVQQAFTGFAALPAPGQVATRPWREVMSLQNDRNVDLDVAEGRYHYLARKRHPDAGGTEALMAELNAAIAAARKELA